MRLIASSSLLLVITGVVLLCTAPLVDGNPTSKPYVPFRTSPFEQDSVVNHELVIPEDHRRSIPRRPDTSKSKANDQCPLQFTLGLSKRAHHAPDRKSMSIIEPPTIYPVHPSYGPGRQVVHSTQYEHLDMLTPADVGTDAKEGLVQHQDYPLLFESSSFLGSPIVHDANGDGIPDVLLTDYDGGLYFVGLQVAKDTKRRTFSNFQIPRLYIRRDWMTQRLNETAKAAEVELKGSEGDDHVNYESNDPYHSYFEYGSKEADSGVLRGVTADVMGQDHSDVKSLEKRRQRKVNHERPEEEEAGEKEEAGENEEVVVEERQEVFQQEGGEYDIKPGEERDEGEATSTHRRLEEQQLDGGDGSQGFPEGDDKDTDDRPGDLDEEKDNANDPEGDDGEGDDREIDFGGEGQAWPDDDAASGSGSEDEEHTQDDEYDEDDPENDHYKYGGYDDYYESRYHNDHNDYYDDKHYIRLPPHVLSTPVLADMKKAYGDNLERDEMLFMAVSYYFDEDEYEGQFSYKRFESTDKGDETEMNRGMHVASALVAFVFEGTPRFGREEHLDMSGDATAPHNATMMSHIPMMQDSVNKMGAFAIGSPTIADIDGNGDEDVIIGTSMGLIYCMHARHMYNTDGWPVQLKHPIESRILVEDVVGDTNLEIFVLDAAANVYCFNAKGEILWRRNLIKSISADAELRGLSPMTMGDVNGDGLLDIVLSMKVISPSSEWSTFVVGLTAATGEDVKNFPLEFDSPLVVDDGTAESDLLEKLAQPLLIDLHSEQDHWKAYISRNGTAWTQPASNKPASGAIPHGGSAAGLHVVQPVGSNLYIIEAGSGCTQLISIGEEIASMVQADDVHGTNNIDLVISTKSGDIVTLESPAVPYHPLNVWNTGEVRGRRNNFAHGFSASQGIFVHEMSRQYRDIFGVYVPITFEIFDNRPNIQNEQDKRQYHVEIRDGTSAKRAMFRKTFNEAGVYTERLYINYGPGYYTLTVLLRTSHGLQYEDVFHLGYNVHYMDGFGLLLWLPLFLASIFIVSCSKRKANWDDDEYDEVARGKNQGILGST